MSIVVIIIIVLSIVVIIIIGLRLVVISRIFLVQVFDPWMKSSEARKLEGLRKPVSLVEACEILGDSKNLQDNAEAKLKVRKDNSS